MIAYYYRRAAEGGNLELMEELAQLLQEQYGLTIDVQLARSHVREKMTSLELDRAARKARGKPGGAGAVSRRASRKLAAEDP